MPRFNITLQVFGAQVWQNSAGIWCPGLTKLCRYLVPMNDKLFRYLVPMNDKLFRYLVPMNDKLFRYLVPRFGKTAGTWYPWMTNSSGIWCPVCIYLAKPCRYLVPRFDKTRLLFVCVCVCVCETQEYVASVEEECLFSAHTVYFGVRYMWQAGGPIVHTLHSYSNVTQHSICGPCC